MGNQQGAEKGEPNYVMVIGSITYAKTLSTSQIGNWPIADITHKRTIKSYSGDRNAQPVAMRTV